MSEMSMSPSPAPARPNAPPVVAGRTIRMPWRRGQWGIHHEIPNPNPNPNPRNTRGTGPIRFGFGFGIRFGFGFGIGFGLGMEVVLLPLDGRRWLRRDV